VSGNKDVASITAALAKERAAYEKQLKNTLASFSAAAKALL
jgi:hypothetical protein